MSLPTYAETYEEIRVRATSILTVTTKTYRTQRLNRKNWQTMVNGGQLVTPYLIIESGLETPTAYAMDSQAYKLHISLYYVVDLTENAVEEVTALMQAVRTAFWQTPLTTCSLMNEAPLMDCTDTNPANAIFFELQANKFAGMLTFDAVVGCGVYVTV